MKYVKTDQTNARRRLNITECIPGEIYELVYTRGESVKRPEISKLRFCITEAANNNNNKQQLYGLDDGKPKASKSPDLLGEFLYIHRPDIQLMIVEEVVE